MLHTAVTIETNRNDTEIGGKPYIRTFSSLIKVCLPQQLGNFSLPAPKGGVCRGK